jgi:beta-phosphoglucomutase-like phosphatase (HAD superfamily)
MLKAVLFDMDGVIVDTEPLHHKAYQQMFSEVGIDVSSEMYEGFTGQSTYGICVQLCSYFKLHQDPQELVQIKRNNFTKLFFEDDDLQLLEGVKDLILEIN